ncbi:MAG TPA: glutamate 5-kinase, partial [Phycisphaerae bacterium]|nr:glutamate 5-kinase [Phycisphaerae bacterium]
MRKTPCGVTTNATIYQDFTMPGKAVREKIASGVGSIVVKVGTSGICDDTGRLDKTVVRSLCKQLAEVMDRGISVTLVASGAVGAGMAEMNLSERPKTIEMLQAVAAVGQGQLMRVFHDVFGRRGIGVGQVLLTREDFEDRLRYLNIRNTLITLSRCGAIPIINENDAVAVDEFRYGDNDIIAALLTNMLSADLLVLLTTVDGLLKGSEVVDVVENIDDDILSLAGSDKSRLGTGGMASKLAAASMVTRAGEMAAIANARTAGVVTKLLAGQQVGTIFVPATRKMPSRK